MGTYTLYDSTWRYCSMFRVFRDDLPTLEFMSFNEFSNWRIKAAAEGYKPHYSHSVRLRGSTYIYCYQLRKMGSVTDE